MNLLSHFNAKPAVFELSLPSYNDYRRHLSDQEYEKLNDRSKFWGFASNAQGCYFSLAQEIGHMAMDFLTQKNDRPEYFDVFVSKEGTADMHLNVVFKCRPESVYGMLKDMNALFSRMNMRLAPVSDNVGHDHQRPNPQGPVLVFR